jgi:hypothetical protein
MNITTYVKLKAKKPVGGFVFLTVQQLCLVWWAYRIRLIHLIDFRVWFAAHEMGVRRCQLDPGQVPEYTLKELHNLVGGVGGEHLRASIRRLEAVGLLTWSSTKLTFATAATALRGIHDLSDLHTMYNAIPNHRRRVPVPRQAIRLIAGGCRATVIATMLGHLIRCLYYRHRRCISGGWCKASWIADVFRLDLRNIKAARKHLVTIGWLQTLATPQTLCNRWGSYILVNLSWTRAAMEKASQDDARTPSSESPPPPAFSTTQLPPPSKEYKEPLQELQHQKPAPQADMAPLPFPIQHAEPVSSGPASGVDTQEREKTKRATDHTPTLSHIVPEDLIDTARLLALFEQAYTQGLIGKGDSERLTFLSLAEHAKVVGSSNPCGLFAALVRRQCWHFVTDSDEDAAHQRFKAYLYGAHHQPRGSPQPHSLAQPELSKDAAIVRYLQTQLARAGFAGDMFGLVSRDDASWTRERWDNAVGELDHARRVWHQGNVLNRLGDLTDLGDPLGALVSIHSACAHFSAA